MFRNQHFHNQHFRRENQSYAPVHARIHGAPVTITGYAQPARYEQIYGSNPDTMGQHAPIRPSSNQPHSNQSRSDTLRNNVNYQLPGNNFRQDQKVETVKGVRFLCSGPTKGARAPANLDHVKHVMAEDASACQLECLEQGKNRCNVYSYKPASFATNCTIGYAATFTQPLDSTDDQESVAGYCVALTDAANSIFYPPVQ